MFQIKTLNKIAKCGLDNFDKSKYTFVDENANPDAIMVRSASMHEMEFNENLLAIARAGAGVNNIPCDKCAQQGIVVFNTPGANANAVKELVIAGLFISSRRVIPAIEWAKTLKGNGDEVGKMVEKGKSAFAGPEILGKKLGVIGLGAIGAMVANSASALGMEVYGYDPYISVNAAWKLSTKIKNAAEIDDIFANCDYITVHVPLLDSTRNTICKESIAKMKDGVRILNFARGELVNSADIIEALQSGKVASYVTDFPNDELIGVDGVIAIPHLGASTPESEDNCAVMAAQELVEYLENGNIINSVNMPNAVMPRTTQNRICVVHKNVPHMISQITGALSGKGINIEKLLNESKKDYAYSLLDVERVDDDAIKAVEKIDGVIKVRVISD
ncbi:MAG: phosphoglycerate dehydrogenase [Acutalibacteraceae bacterium]|nr:phosphoglycerate dehydrogenase [Acutalibacteraceae bacterium]